MLRAGRLASSEAVQPGADSCGTEAPMQPALLVAEGCALALAMPGLAERSGCPLQAWTERAELPLASLVLPAARGAPMAPVATWAPALPQAARRSARESRGPAGRARVAEVGALALAAPRTPRRDEAARRSAGGPTVRGEPTTQRDRPRCPRIEAGTRGSVAAAAAVDRHRRRSNRSWSAADRLGESRRRPGRAPRRGSGRRGHPAGIRGVG